jgi:uncharacterized protein YecE (DUF72 family)
LQVLQQAVLLGTKFVSPKIYVGFPKWGYKEWVCGLYPAGTKDAQFLDNYVRHLNSIELNATHYKIYTPAEISKWAIKAKGKDFKFCPKITNSISHYSGFTNADQLTTDFLAGVMAFEENLGPIFLQVNEKFSPNQKDKLYNYLRSLPTDLSFFVEVRHPDWFRNPIRNELFDTLRSLNMGAVISDTIERRDVVHMHLTKPQAMIRFVCKGNDPLDYYRIQNWKIILKEWFRQGLEECYFFIHSHNDDASSIDLALHIQKEFGSIV